MEQESPMHLADAGGANVSGFIFPDNKWHEDRKKDALVLILRFLHDNGYGSTYQALCQESQLSLNQVDAADNMDLVTILKEYVLYFHGKYGKQPILTKPLAAMGVPGMRHPSESEPASPYQQQPSQRLPGVAGTSPVSSATLMPRTAGIPASMSYLAPPMAMPAAAASDTLVPPTYLLSTQEIVTQEQLVSLLNATGERDPSRLFHYKKPSRTSKNPNKVYPDGKQPLLRLEDMQEHILYALVGCEGVGWSMRNVAESTREFLLTHYGITKDILQLFFKNRAQKRQKRVNYGMMKHESPLEQLAAGEQLVE